MFKFDVIITDAHSKLTPSIHYTHTGKDIYDLLTYSSITVGTQLRKLGVSMERQLCQFYGSSTVR